MVDSFFIESHLLGMALGNSILVFPRYQKHRDEYRRLTIFSTSMSIAMLFAAIIIMVFAFSGPLRLLERLINPAPQSFTLYNFLAYLISLLIHFCVLFQLLIYKLKQPVLLNFTLILTVCWSVLVMASFLLFANIHSGKPITLIISGYLYFYSLSFAGGQILLFAICKIYEKKNFDKYSTISINKLTKSAVFFSILSILFGAAYYLRA